MTTTSFTIKDQDPRINGEWVFKTDITLVEKRKARQEFELLTGLDLDVEHARTHKPEVANVPQVASLVAGNASFLTFMAYLPYLFISHNGASTFDFDALPEDLRISLYNNFAVSKAVIALTEQKKKLDQRLQTSRNISRPTGSPTRPTILGRLKRWSIRYLANSPVRTVGQ